MTEEEIKKIIENHKIASKNLREAMDNEIAKSALYEQSLRDLEKVKEYLRAVRAGAR